MGRRAVRWASVVAAVALLPASQPGVRADTQSAEADWFVVVLTAGPGGASGIEAGFSTRGRTTGETIVLGMGVGNGDTTIGRVSSSIEGGVRVGSGGALPHHEIELTPSIGDDGLYRSANTVSSDFLGRGKQLAFVVFASGTLSRSGSVNTKVKAGSVTAKMFTGTGARGLLLLDNSEGVAAEAAAAGAGVAVSKRFKSPGLFGGFSACSACRADWEAPDGRVGDSQSGASLFAGPSGEWALNWSGLTAVEPDRATIGGYAPIGEHSKHFKFAPLVA